MLKSEAYIFIRALLILRFEHFIIWGLLSWQQSCQIWYDHIEKF